MATQTKTWTFVGSSEGLADAGGSSVLTFQYQGGDGTPAGCVEVTGTGINQTEAETGLNPSTAATWASIFGIAPTSTVTQAQCKNWYFKCRAGGGLLSAASLRARIVDSGGASVTSGDGDLIPTASLPVTAGGWTSGGAKTTRNVDGGRQAATTSIRLELYFSVTWTDGSEGTLATEAVDQIQVQITYNNDLNLMPDTATATATADGPELSLGAAQLTPDTANATAEAYFPLVVGAEIGLTPDTAEASATVDDPGLAATVTITPDAAEATAAPDDPVLTPGGPKATPSTATTTTAAYAPTIFIRVPITLTPSPAMAYLYCYGPELYNTARPIGLVAIGGTLRPLISRRSTAQRQILLHGRHPT